jgi:hydroxymethylglutaryl-CoA lyase
LALNLPQQVRIVEVGPRDGLQNESQAISLNTRLELVSRLANAGLQTIEFGSFVSPKWVPQMAASGELYQRLDKSADIRYTALTPNVRGFNEAAALGVKEIAVFAAASEQFSQKNINCSIDESIERFRPVLEQARSQGIAVRGYVSCVIGCPYEGAISPERVLAVTDTLLAMGCYEVSLGDTIGVGTPGTFAALLDQLLHRIPPEKLALHCHNTYGQALANIFLGLQYGICTIDSAIAGLGGCPYAKGASGNVATEDVVYMLEHSGIKTGLAMEHLVETGQWISSVLNRPNGSKVGQALATCAT